MTTATPIQIAAVRAALTSPDLTLVSGKGNATRPGEGRACTVTAIRMVLTGVLDDGSHPCMSDVIRRWVIRAQDAMPDELRNGLEWRTAAVGLVNSAAGAEAETRRAAMIMDWMWSVLEDPAVVAAVPERAREAWAGMLRGRTAAAAYAATDAAYAAAASAAYAASAASDAAARVALWERHHPARLLAALTAVTDTAPAGTDAGGRR